MKNLLLAFMMLVIGGCGATGSPVLDAMVGGMSVTKVEGYFNLDPEQEKAFEKSLDKDLQRLKKERLEEVAKSLRKVDERIPTEKSDSQILGETFDLLEQEYVRASGYFKNSALQLTKSLRKDQFEYFEKTVRKEIAEDRKESVENKNEALRERYSKQIKQWIGKMDVHQENALNQFITNKPFPWKERIDNRENILNTFIEKRDDSKKVQAMTEQFMIDYDQLRTPEYAKAITQYEIQFKDFLNKFWTSLSTEQKREMQISLNKQAQELDRLAAYSSLSK
ncbi:DUF6279 family lipoprotein [Bdellovibrio sp. HCB209]|uniref:DUF6279 family lipoprotein n=1 Tax=Bdellovibrio sp. HCB209 TaxID=3394354 RepID=UPI0039B3ADC6